MTAEVEGRVATAVPEVVLGCVRDAGRSQPAAALAQHLAGARVHVRSAGSRPAGGADPPVVTVLAERGIALTEAFPAPLAERVVQAADVSVTMGCGDAGPVYPGKRYLDGDVPDPEGQPVEAVRDVPDDRRARVSTPLRELGV